MFVPTDRPLAKILMEIPDDVFWITGSESEKPAYNRIFAEVLRLVLQGSDHDSTLRIRDVYSGQIPNLSSFQRAVAKEAARRRKGREVLSKPQTESASSEEPPARPALPPAPLDPVASDLPRCFAPLDLLSLRSRAEKALGSQATALLFRSLRLEARARPEDLVARVERHMRRLERARESKRLDLPQARRIGTTLLHLVASTRDAPSEVWGLVTATVDHYTCADGRENGIDPPVGGQDRSAVVAWVVHELGLGLDTPRPDHANPVLAGGPK